MTDCCALSHILFDYCGCGVFASGDASEGFDPDDLVNGSGNNWQATGTATVTVDYDVPQIIDAIAIYNVCASEQTSITVSNDGNIIATFQVTCDGCSCATLFKTIEPIEVSSLDFCLLYTSPSPRDRG